MYVPSLKLELGTRNGKRINQIKGQQPKGKTTNRDYLFLNPLIDLQAFWHGLIFINFSVMVFLVSSAIIFPFFITKTPSSQALACVEEVEISFMCHSLSSTEVCVFRVIFQPQRSLDLWRGFQSRNCSCFLATTGTLTRSHLNCDSSVTDKQEQLLKNLGQITQRLILIHCELLS